MHLLAPLRSVRRYVGKMKTIRDEIRTERSMNSLSDELRKDIGWPDSARSRQYRQLPPLR